MLFTTDFLAQLYHRAAHYDANNEFASEDYNDLKKIGYYKALVPKEYGGLGLSLKEMVRHQTQLAMVAPATALGINMHQIIVGMAKHMVKFGNTKGEQILRDAVNDHLLAFAISEASNDRVLFGSICQAKPDENQGYHFYGEKVFLSMAKQCDHLVTYATDSTGESPLSIFAYLDNSSDTIVTKDDWNTLGMRATQSHTTILNGAYASEEKILTKLAPGPNFNPVVFGIFAYFEIFLAATYFGIGKRALEIGIETVKSRQSIANQTTYDQDKNIRWRIAEAAITLEGIQAQIDQ